jgi:ADP-ribose pyrophosphatase YjhB (NUDIX family)
MNQLWSAMGKTVFWLGWPFLLIYLSFGHRTRIVVEANGKILVVKSWLGNGEWGLPGGGLHKGETARLGAVRELYEETGVWLKPEQLTELYKAVANQRGLRFRYTCYGVKLPKSALLQKQVMGITDVAWLAPEQITKKSSTVDTVKALQSWKKR